MRQLKRKIKRLLIFFLIISFGVGAPSLFKNNSDASENIDESEVTNSIVLISLFKEAATQKNNNT